MTFERDTCAGDHNVVVVVKTSDRDSILLGRLSYLLIHSGIGWKCEDTTKVRPGKKKL